MWWDEEWWNVVDTLQLNLCDARGYWIIAWMALEDPILAGMMGRMEARGRQAIAIGDGV